MTLSAVEPLSSEEIDAEPATVAAETARKVSGVSDACKLAIDLELFISEKAAIYGPGFGVVLRAALCRVLGRTFARRKSSNDPHEMVAMVEAEFDKAKAAIR
jgi:hypothetical protein